jgi:glycosyltransferase involved in cell wall biosynthesis
MNKQKFSVIIPARNEEDVINRAIQSIINQTYDDWELIVSNDGSTDKTEEIVEKLSQKDNRIKIINRKEGHSAAFARNRGAEHATGDILLFLDADTKVNSKFLEAIEEESEKADAFITLNYPLKENKISHILSAFVGKPIKEKLPDKSIYDKSNKDEAGEMFFVMKKEIYDKLGGYNEKIFYYEDQEIVDKFYNQGYKTMFIKGANQYYELPSTINEFKRQCQWIAKGVSSIKNKKVRKERKIRWMVKTLILISPLFVVFNPSIFLVVLLIVIAGAYLSLVARNKSLGLSFVAIPFLYMKTILVTYHLIKDKLINRGN